MIKTITFDEFCDSFSGSYKDNFSYKGKEALFEYLEQLEDDIGKPIELDPVALCCEYGEFENLKDLQDSYPDIKNLDDLKYHTTVIEFDGGFIIQQY